MNLSPVATLAALDERAAVSEVAADTEVARALLDRNPWMVPR